MCESPSISVSSISDSSESDFEEISLEINQDYEDWMTSFPKQGSHLVAIVFDVGLLLLARAQLGVQYCPGVQSGRHQITIFKVHKIYHMHQNE